MIASSVVFEVEVLPAYEDGGHDIPDLSSWIDEAYACIIVHVEWAICVKNCKCIVVYNDTDSFALLIYYIPHIQTLGLKKWYWLKV